MKLNILRAFLLIYMGDVESDPVILPLLTPSGRWFERDFGDGENVNVLVKNPVSCSSLAKLQPESAVTTCKMHVVHFDNS